MKSVALALIPLFLLGVGYLTYTSSTGGKAVNLRPIIAVLSQPTYGACDQWGKDYESYIAGSYIQYVESMGARAVPVFYDDTIENIQTIIDQVDGVLFPGGGVDLIEKGSDGKMQPTRYLEIQGLFFEASINKKAKGINFPIMGTCLGFEALALLVMHDKYLDSCYAHKIASTQTLVDPDDSKLFANVSQDMRTALHDQKLVFENHEWCVHVEHYNNTPELNKFFRMTSTGIDEKGNEYVNSWEARDFPIIAHQYHPEKNIFEWNSPNIPHEGLAVEWAQYIADYFGDQARMNPQKFMDSTVETKSLIYNYDPFFAPDGYFEQMYCFKAADKN